MNDIIIFDTETTGLPQPGSSLKGQPHITEFAGIKLDSNLNEIDRLEFLVDPDVPIPEIITKLTGITDEKVKGQGKFCTHLEKLQNFFIGCKKMVAHNLMFDHDMIEFELRRINKVTQFPWPPVRYCTIEKSFHINRRRMKLAQLHKHFFGEEFSGAHRAMVDVEALTRCYLKLREEENETK